MQRGAVIKRGGDMEGVSFERSEYAHRERLQAMAPARPVALRRPALMLILWLCALSAHVGLSPTPADAELTHAYLTQISGPAPGEPFAHPWSLAFGSAGDLFAVDPGNSIVDVFGPDNAPRARVGS